MITGSCIHLGKTSNFQASYSCCILVVSPDAGTLVQHINSCSCAWVCCDSLIDWILDTLSQGYTNLQSLVKCLDHRDIVSDTVCSQAKVMLGCAMYWNASRRLVVIVSSASAAQEVFAFGIPDITFFTAQAFILNS